MSEFLRNYLERKRADTNSKADSEETAELLQSLNSNISLVASSNEANASTSKKILGAIESQVAIQQQRDTVYESFTKEQIGAMYQFSEAQKIQSASLSKSLKQLNDMMKRSLGVQTVGTSKSLASQMEESNKVLHKIADYLKPDTTRSKRDAEAREVAGRKGLRKDSRPSSKQHEQRKSRRIVDDLGDLFDFEDDIDRKKKRGRRGSRRGPRGRGRAIGSVGKTAGDVASKGSWWDKLKGKAGSVAEGAAESGKSLFSKMPSVLKGGASVLGKLAAPVGAALDVGSGISDLTDGKRQTEMPTGWDMISPMRWGMYAGEKINQGYEAASTSLGGSGNMIEDGINSVSAIGNSIESVFKHSIVPGFNNVSNNMGKFADDFGVSAKSLVTGLGKDLEDLGDNLKQGASATWAGVKQFAQNPVATTVGAAKAAAKAVDKKTGGLVRKGVDALRGESSGIGKGRYTEEEQAAISAAREKGEKFRGGSGLSADQKAKIDEAAKKYGVDPQAMKTMAQIESGGNSNAVSATGAVGMYQFTGGTGKQYGIKNRFDEGQNIDAAARLMRDNKAALEKRGIEATPQNLYLAHQQGVGGAAKIINAAKNGTQLDPETAKNMGLNYGNMSAKEYLAANEKKFAAAQKASEKTVEKTELASSKPTAVGTIASKTPAATEAEEKKKVEVAASKAVADKVAKTETPAAQGGQPSVAASKQPTQVASASQATSAPEVRAKKAAQPMVDQSAPVEAKPVQVANAEQMTPKIEMPPQAAASGGSTASTVPTLDSIPLQITDMGLVLLNIGHV